MPDIRVERITEAVVVIPSGELDLLTAQSLRDRLRGVTDEQPPLVIVDMAEVTFIDVAGLAPVLEAHRELASRGIELRIAHPAPVLARMIGILDPEMADEAPDAAD